ncbi:MAG: hypothetical protein RL095_2296 [Verrucomicrobiota bacterium]
MSRVQLIERETARGETRELLDIVHGAFGGVPNVAKVLANSPAALKGFLQLSGALGEGLLGVQLQDKIKLVTSESNSCDYCKAALCAIGSSHGLSAADLLGARKAEAADPKAEAALKLAKQLVEDKGHVPAAAIQAAKAAGLSDGEIVETIATVVLGFYTNYLNNALKPEVDFAAAPALD